MRRSLLFALLLCGCSVEPVADAPVPAIAPPPGYELPEGEAIDTGFVALGAEFTAAMPDGYEQQVPDSSLVSPPAKIDVAMQGAMQQLADSRAEIHAAYEAAKAGGIDEVVLLQGVPGHGVGEGASATDMKILLTPDEPTAVTTHNVCSNLILSCAERSGSFDACVDAVPQCRSEEPWTVGEDCCPKACKDGYSERRARGTVFLEAFMKTFVHDWSCFPGMPARSGADK